MIFDWLGMRNRPRLSHGTTLTLRDGSATFFVFFVPFVVESCLTIGQAEEENFLNHERHEEHESCGDSFNKDRRKN